MLARGTVVIFSIEHSATLLVLGIVAVALTLAARRAARRPSGAITCRYICVGIAAVTAGGAIFKQVYEMARGEWTLQNSLPLHLCDIGVWVTAGALVLTAPSTTLTSAAPVAQTSPRPDAVARWRWAQPLYELVYFWGLGGTLQALITPDVQEPFPDPTYFRYFVTHGGVVTGVLVLTFGFGWRPRRRAWRWVWLATAALAAVVLGIDGLVGANYMFLCGPPENPSILDYLGPWPVSLLWLSALATGLILLLNGPWWLLDRMRDAREPAAAARAAHSGPEGTRTDP